MSNNTLKKQLKASVNNENLPILGVLRIKANALTGTPDISKQCCMVLTSNEDVEITVSGSGYFGTNASTIDTQHLTYYKKQASSAQVSLFFSNGNYDVYVNNKYSIKKILLGNTYNTDAKLLSLDLDELVYGNLIELECSNSNTKGNIENLKSNPIITTLRCGYNFDIKGNISVLSTFASLSKVDFGNCFDVEGNISSLENITTLTQVNFMGLSKVYGNIGALKNSTGLVNITVSSSNITGNIAGIGALKSLTTLYPGKATGVLEDLCEAMVTAGRTSGVLHFYGNGIITRRAGGVAGTCNITFDSSLPNGYSIS